jgi:hypothetical protein
MARKQSSFGKSSRWHDENEHTQTAAKKSDRQQEFRTVREAKGEKEERERGREEEN